MKCPHCGEWISTPTKKQIEAYKLVHIMGLSQREVGKVMGINQKSVHGLIKRLFKKNPYIYRNNLIPHHSNINKGRIGSYEKNNKKRVSR